MRELKFRIWCRNMKRWLCEDSQYLQMDGKKVHAAPWSTINFDLPNEQYVIQQYTGFTDLNKKEIYEGDIFKSDNNRKWDPVEFKNGQWQANLQGARAFSLYEMFDGFGTADYLEVIGNIFENKQ